MDLRHAVIALNDEDPVSVLPDLDIDVNYDVSFSVQNISDNIVYLGNSGLSQSSFGIKLVSGATASFEGVSRLFPLYGISESGTSASVAVLRVSM